MKLGLLMFVAGSALVALGPYEQRQVEMGRIIDTKEVREAIQDREFANLSSGVVDSIANKVTALSSKRLYVIKTGKCKLEVNVVYIPNPRPGPAEFKVELAQEELSCPE